MTLTTHKTDRFLGRCLDCVRPIAAEVPDRRGDFLKVGCPECGQQIRLERVYGTYSDGVDCDASCQAALGPVCVCTCGGANHGAGFVRWEGEELASALSKYRRATANRRAAATKRAQAKREAEEAAQAAERQAFVAAHADVLAWLNAQGPDNFFASDLCAYFRRTGSLSERQVAAVRRGIARDAEAAARRQVAKGKVPAPTGLVMVEGTVVSTKWQEGQYGPTLKMLVSVSTPEGEYRVWSTVPKVIASEVDKGQSVRFEATLTRSNDDESFAFAYRPAKAEVMVA